MILFSTNTSYLGNLLCPFTPTMKKATTRSLNLFLLIYQQSLSSIFFFSLEFAGHHFVSFFNILTFSGLIFNITQDPTSNHTNLCASTLFSFPSFLSFPPLEEMLLHLKSQSFHTCSGVPLVFSRKYSNNPQIFISYF